MTLRETESVLALVAEIESMRQQLSAAHENVRIANSQTEEFERKWYLAKDALEDSQKQVTLLREELEKYRGQVNQYGKHTAADALDATDDLDGLILCHAEPAAIVYRDYGGNGAILQTELADDEPLYRAWEPK